MMNTNCSLDFAEWGGMTQREVAKALQLRLKDVVEAEKTGMEKLRNGLRGKPRTRLTGMIQLPSPFSRSSPRMACGALRYMTE